MPTWSAPISLKGVKGDSTPQTLPNDLSANSVAVAPVSGDNTASAITQRNASGTTVFASDPSGNVTVAGTLNAAGAATLGAISGASLAVTGNETVGGNLSVTGTLTAGALTASGTNIGGNQTVQGNDQVNGTLNVGGATTLAALSATSITDSGTLNVAGGTTLAGLSATTGSFSGQLNAASVVVSGTLTPNGDVNVGGKLTVQKNVVVNGGTQTVGLLTATGGLSSPNNGISVVGGTTTDTLSCSGNGSIAGTVGLGTTTASALTTTGNLRSNGNFTVATGTSALGGPMNVTGAATLGSTLSVAGASTLAALTASSSSITGNESVGGTLNVTGTTTAAAVNATNVSASGTLSVTGASTVAAVTSSGTVTAPNVTLTSGGNGKLTFADGTTQTTAATGGAASTTGSRTILDLGGSANANQPANQLWTYTLTQGDENTSNGASGRLNPGQLRYPFPFTVTGWAFTQYQPRGTQTFQIVKNRTGSNMGTVVTVTAGNATITGFPGNSFQGTFPKGTYNFAAGDTIGAVGQNSNAGASDVHLYLTIEWT